MQDFKMGAMLALSTFQTAWRRFNVFWHIAMPWGAVYVVFSLLQAALNVGKGESLSLIFLWSSLLFMLLQFTSWNWLNLLQRREARLTWQQGWHGTGIMRFVGLAFMGSIGVGVMVSLVMILPLTLVMMIARPWGDGIVDLIQWLWIFFLLGLNMYIFARLLPLNAFALLREKPAIPLVWQLTRGRPRIALGAALVFMVANIISIVIFFKFPLVVSMVFSAAHSLFACCWIGLLSQKLLEVYQHDS